MSAPGPYRPRPARTVWMAGSRETPAEADRLPPQNIEAEQGVIGGTLLDSSDLPEVVEIVRPEQFYRENHVIIWGAIVRLFDAGAPVDVIGVAELLRKDGTHDAVGGDEALIQAIASVPHAANVKYHAHIVAEKAHARDIIDFAQNALRLAYSNTLNSDDLRERVEKDFLAATDSGRIKTARSSRHAMIDTMASINRRQSGQEWGFLTGLTDLDAFTTGLYPGNLVIVGARPSMGKTAFALRLLERAAFHEDAPAVLFSFETSELGICSRLLGMHSGISTKKMRMVDGLTNFDLAKLGQSYTKWAEPEFWIDDSTGITVQQLCSRVRRMRSRQKISLVVIDYLQLIDGDGRGSREREIATITRKIKALARDVDAPIVLLSQLNRRCEDREDKRPKSSDLRESGAIEQDADLIFLLHRPEFYDPADQPGVAEVIVSKFKEGQTGIVRVGWKRDCMRFDDLDPQDDPENAAVPEF
jgi:replicative DNA helicase